MDFSNLVFRFINTLWHLQAPAESGESGYSVGSFIENHFKWFPLFPLVQCTLTQLQG